MQFWEKWTSRSRLHGQYAAQLERSLITLKALTYRHTGGIVAAPTTSLPEQIGGERNWDYRYCWLRDATFTLLALMNAGYFEEAKSWHDWLLRAVAGSPDQVQIMYGIRGERNLLEWEIPWLSGYEKSKPVRIGNAASEQMQLDVYGELADALLHAQLGGLRSTQEDVGLLTALTEHLATVWNTPDSGIWEVRGEPQHFTYSKVMAWVAFDRAIKMLEKSVEPDVIQRWSQIRDQIHNEVCEKGYNEKLGSFTQAYGTEQLDASSTVDSASRLPALRRSPRARHDRGDREAPDGRWLCPALPHGTYGRRASSRRRSVSGLQLLDGQRLEDAGPRG